MLWPVLLFFQAIGDIAWLPILLIWFGFGLTTMIFVIVYTVLFPVVLNTVLGVRSVPIELHRAALSLGASRARVVWEVVPELAETIIREELERLIKERGT